MPWRGPDGSGVCSFTPAVLPELSCCSREQQTGADSKGSAPFCGYRSRAGCLIAIQTMPVRIRLTVPISSSSINAAGVRAQSGLQNQTSLGQHQAAAPISGHSIIQEVSRFAPGSAGSEAPVVHQFHNQQGNCPGQWSVKPPSTQMPEADRWRATTSSHHLYFLRAEVEGVEIRALGARESGCDSRLPDHFFAPVAQESSAAVF